MAGRESPPPSAPSMAPISFGFTRTSVRRRLADLGDGERQDPEEKDFLATVEGRELQSVNPPEAPKELVIPLIQNGSRRQPLSKNPKPSSETSTVLMSDGVLSQAVKELIEGEWTLSLCSAPVQIEGEDVGRIGCGLIDPSHSSLESKKSLEERENAGVDPTLTIPMIQKGCTPIEEGSDSEPQAETVPEEADYEAVPVEAYGLAMLRGMGWKPGKGIGNTFSQVSQLCKAEGLRTRCQPDGGSELDLHRLSPPTKTRWGSRE